MGIYWSLKHLINQARLIKLQTGIVTDRAVFFAEADAKRTPDVLLFMFIVTICCK